VVATHEPVIAFASKFLIDKVQRKSIRECFNSSNDFVLFVALGIVIPIMLNSLYTYHYSFVNGDLQKVLLLFLSDFITVFTLSLPLLYFYNPKSNGLPTSSTDDYFLNKARKPKVEFFSTVGVFVVLSFFVPFGQYWFIYGIVAVVIGVRQGFESVLLINTIIYLLIYIMPLIGSSTAIITSSGSTQLVNVHLGNATMLFISTLVGRVVSDLKMTEKKLVHQKQEIEKTNQQLNQTNQELDRFVYSVSHDLSAPLKSIQGLIQISRMDAAKNNQSFPYLDMMEKSATRLNDFINEVLDYSRTSRKELEYQEVRLPELMNELKEKFMLPDSTVNLKLTIEAESVFTDPTLLKIGLGNLFSNAMKFQKKFSDHEPFVEVKSWQTANETFIEVNDNGEGIAEDHVSRIFEMFYRATNRSPGSGLGLYIAQEAITKLGGRISVKTTYGVGSTFVISLPKSK
jgi:two-component system, sensor histidine kinase